MSSQCTTTNQGAGESSKSANKVLPRFLLTKLNPLTLTLRASHRFPNAKREVYGNAPF